MKLELMPVFWLALTLGAYFFSRWIYRRTGRYLLSPLILVPVLFALVFGFALVGFKGLERTQMLAALILAGLGVIGQRSFQP